MHFLVAAMLFVCNKISVIAQTPLLCTDCAPNPIASFYPDQITGTINSTIAVIPIPYSHARRIIPAQYGILNRAYEKLLSDCEFPPDSYPLIVRSGCDHGITVQAANFGVPDFQNIHFDYPFVDLLGDGYTSFKYGHYFPVTASNAFAIQGNLDYGGIPVPAVFNPTNMAYRTIGNEINFSAFTNGTNAPIMSAQYNVSYHSLGLYPLHFYVNVTNQPQFYNGSSCDLQNQLFNTTLSTGANAPKGIRGTVSINAPYFPTTRTFKDISGIAVDLAFIETNFMPCASLQGYHST